MDSNPVFLVLIGALAAWLLSGAMDILIYAIGFAGLIGLVVWLLGIAERSKE